MVSQRSAKASSRKAILVRFQVAPPDISGSVTEWTIVTASKAAGPQGSLGSNPSTSSRYNALITQLVE